MAKIPNNQHITYQYQYRKCGKASCGTCRNGQGHGPYWYAYWREGSRLRSAYIGKTLPTQSLPYQTSSSNKPRSPRRNGKHALAHNTFASAQNQHTPSHAYAQ
jgi:hypothetical protein